MRVQEVWEGDRSRYCGHSASISTLFAFHLSAIEAEKLRENLSPSQTPLQVGMVTRHSCGHWHNLKSVGDVWERLWYLPPAWNTDVTDDLKSCSSHLVVMRGRNERNTWPNAVEPLNQWLTSAPLVMNNNKKIKINFYSLCYQHLVFCYSHVQARADIRTFIIAFFSLTFFFNVSAIFW